MARCMGDDVTNGCVSIFWRVLSVHPFNTGIILSAVLSIARLSSTEMIPVSSLYAGITTAVYEEVDDIFKAPSMWHCKIE